MFLTGPIGYGNAYIVRRCWLPTENGGHQIGDENNFWTLRYGAAISASIQLLSHILGHARLGWMWHCRQCLALGDYQATKRQPPKPEVTMNIERNELATRFQRLYPTFATTQAGLLHLDISRRYRNSRWRPPLPYSVAAIYFFSRKTADNVDSVISKSALVENIGGNFGQFRQTSQIYIVSPVCIPAYRPIAAIAIMCLCAISSSTNILLCICFKTK